MSKLRPVEDVRVALSLLTRLPTGGGAIDARPDAAWAWPLAGMVPAAAGAVSAWFALLAGLPTMIAAGIAIAAAIVVTGGLHEDGLADTADGLWGGWSVERRLAIMKDSRIGTYGVLALVFAQGLRWAALSELIAGGAVAAPLVAAAILSRAAMLPVAAALPHARSGGLSASVGRPGVAAALAGIAAALALSGAILGPGVVAAAIAAALAALALMRLGRVKLGGQTGDLLGATQQVAEIAVLIALVAWR